MQRVLRWLAMEAKGGDEEREFRWLVYARGVAAAALLLLSLIAGWRELVPSIVPLLGVSLFIGGYTLASIWTLTRRRVNSDQIVLGTLLLDILSLTVYVHFSGDIENPLLFAYALPVAAGAILLGRRRGLYLAGAAFFIFSILMAFTLFDDLPFNTPHHHLALLHDLNLHERIDPDSGSQGADFIVAHVLVLAALLFGSAYGFGTLGERVREKEVELRGERDKLLLLLRILPEGAVLLGRDGTILLANASAHRLVPGLDQGNIHRLEGTIDVAAQLAGFQPPVREFETSANGRTLAHALAADQPGGPFVWVIRDVTVERQMLGKLMHSSKMADLGLLAAGIAHEIGNPLSTMSAIVQVLEMKKPPPEFVDRLHALGTSVERINRIVQDIGSFSRPSAGRRTSAPFATLVERAAGIFRFHEKSKAMQLEVDCPATLPDVELVEDQVVQVLLNLLLNAADASKGQGKVKVEVRMEGGDLVFSVRDYGTGIDPELQKRLFTPFFTTKEQGKGQGLGLFISESIVRGHGGRMEVVSTAGTGATFIVRLPLKRGAA